MRNRAACAAVKDSLDRLTFLLEGSGAPDADGRLRAAGPARQQGAVARKGERFDAGDMSGQGSQQLTGAGLPRLDGLVLAAAGQDGAVGGEGDGIDFAVVALEDMQRVAAEPGPQAARCCRRCCWRSACRRATRRRLRRSFCVPGARAEPCRSGHPKARTVLSVAPLTRRLPSGDHATERTWPVCPSSVRSEAPVDTFHSRTVLSTPLLTSIVPSGEKATERTMSVCPSNVCMDCLLLTSHKRMVLSALPEASVLPSGEKATL